MGTRLQWEQCHNEVHEYHIPPLITRLYRHRTRSSLSCAEAQLKLSERPSLCALKHAYNTVSGSEQIKERLWALSAILSARYHHHRASMGPSFRASTMAAYGVIATWVTAPGQQYALFAFVNWASRPSLQCQALHHPIPHQVPASSCMPYFKRAYSVAQQQWVLQQTTDIFPPITWRYMDFRRKYVNCSWFISVNSSCFSSFQKFDGKSKNDRGTNVYSFMPWYVQSIIDIESSHVLVDRAVHSWASPVTQLQTCIHYAGSTISDGPL